MMRNLTSKPRVVLRIICSSEEDAYEACHKGEYQTLFGDYVDDNKTILEDNSQPLPGTSGRILVEDVDSRVVYFKNKPCAEFRATLNLEDFF